MKHEDPLGPVTGISNGVLLGLLLWIAAFLLFLVVAS